jgi:hypothetical protein
MSNERRQHGSLEGLNSEEFVTGNSFGEGAEFFRLKNRNPFCCFTSGRLRLLKQYRRGVQKWGHWYRYLERRN